LQVVQAGIAAAVHPRAEEDQPARARDQRGEQVRGQDVDREDVAQAVWGGYPPRLPVADARVVDDRVERARGPGLPGQLGCLADDGQVAHEHSRRARRARLGVAGPGLAARVQDDLVALADQQARGHLAEPVGGAGDQDSCH
jgi:hypothetical protein